MAGTAWWSVIPIASEWMRWNLLLAWIPLVLSVLLFRVVPQRSPFWWLGVAVFVAFLPNAPYILTDVIHLVEEMQHTDSRLVGSLIIFPKYLLFLLLGFGAYVLSLVNLGLYVQAAGRRSWELPLEWTLHGLSAIGIYLGRFDRLNSWDLVTQPGQVLVRLGQILTTGRSLLIILALTVGLAGLYWLGKQVVLGLRALSHLRRQSPV